MLTSIYTLIEFLLKRASSKNFQYRFLGVNAISMMPRSYLRQSFIALLSHFLCLCNTLFFPFISFSLSLSIHFVSLQPSFLFAFHTNTYFFSLLSSSLPLLFQAIFSDLNHCPYSVSPPLISLSASCWSNLLISFPHQHLVNSSITEPRFSFSLSLSHTRTVPHTLSQTPTFSHPLSLYSGNSKCNLPHITLPLSLSIYLTHSYFLFISLSLSLLAIKSLSHSHSHSLSRSLRGPLPRKQLELIQMFNTNKTTDSSS